MRCEWQENGKKGSTGKETVYADWMKELRPDHLKDIWEVDIGGGDLGFPIFIGTFEFPQFRPVYVRVLGDSDDELRQNAKACLDKSTDPFPRVLLSEDAKRCLKGLVASENAIPDEKRLLFVHLPEHVLGVETRSREPFPLHGLVEVLRIGPAVPELSIGDLFERTAETEAEDGSGAGSDDAPDPPPVVTAVIDADIGIANARFCKTKGESGAIKTRVAHFWRQENETVLLPRDLTIGREFDEVQINAMLCAANGDEARFYRLLRSADYGIEAATVPAANGAANATIAERAADPRVETDGQSEISPMRRAFFSKLLYFLATDGPIEYVKSKDAPRGAQESATINQLFLDPLGWSDTDTRTTRTIDESEIAGSPDILNCSVELLRAPPHAAIGYSRPIGFRAGHGTHILDLAAGLPTETAPDDRPIVAVELPDYVIEDTSGARLEVFCLLAVRRILDWVDNWKQTGKAVPVVINISLANAAGPKDGTGFLEAELARLAEAREKTSGIPTKFVLSSGNSFRDRLDAHFTIAKPETIEWRVPPGDHSASYLEIRADPMDQLELIVEAPGVAPKKMNVSKITDLECGGRAVGRLYLTVEGGHTVLTLALAPTLALDPPSLQAPAGTYRLTFRNTGQRRLKVRLGVQRDDTLSGYRAYGKQTYLDHPSLGQRDPETGGYERPAIGSPVSRRGTISAYATNNGTEYYVTGGAYADPGRDNRRRPARYTGSGPTAGPRAAPDLAAVSEDGAGTPGRLASGYFSGSTVVLRGTSSAAATVTRAIVDELAAAGGTDVSKDDMLKALLAAPSAPSPDLRLGAGVVETRPEPGRVARRRYSIGG